MATNQLERELREAKYAGIEFLLADIESAHTILDVAAANVNPETVQRNVANARRTLAAVKHFLAHLGIEAELLAEVEGARNGLQSRVDAFAGR